MLHRSMSEPSRKARGYCPGVWTPMPSGDGLIVRVRPRHARMAASDVCELARLARATGNGIIELTRRGNLQIRGVSTGSWPELRAELVGRGLAGAEPESESRPLLFVCPLSGLDPRCPPLEPLAEALLEVLASPMVQRLPDKFSVVLGGGSSVSSALSADIHVRLHPAHPRLADLLLGGNADEAIALGVCDVNDVAEAVGCLLRALPLERRRMRGAALTDLAPLRDAVQHLRRGAALREPSWGSPEVGYHTGTRDWFGYSLPFGSANAEAWGALGRLAERLGAGEVRFTSTRHVLVIGVRPEDRPALVEFGQRHMFGVRRLPGALELVACSGAPACASAHGETRELAQRLGKLLDGSGTSHGTLHVSGCEKSCARGEAADITLVHAADGLRLGFGRDVRATLATRPVSLDGVRQQLIERFVRVRPAPRGPAAARESER
jgi:precorrin-3B synthase